jgi:hypothetical protein
VQGRTIRSTRTGGDCRGISWWLGEVGGGVLARRQPPTNFSVARSTCAPGAVRRYRASWGELGLTIARTYPRPGRVQRKLPGVVNVGRPRTASRCSPPGRGRIDHVRRLAREDHPDIAAANPRCPGRGLNQWFHKLPHRIFRAKGRRCGVGARALPRGHRPGSRTQSYLTGRGSSRWMRRSGVSIAGARLQRAGRHVAPSNVPLAKATIRGAGRSA